MHKVPEASPRAVKARRGSAASIITNRMHLPANTDLTQQWAERFEGMTYELTENGETYLTGQIADQSALHSLLRTIRDAGLELLSINQKT